MLQNKKQKKEDIFTIHIIQISLFILILQESVFPKCHNVFTSSTASGSESELPSAVLCSGSGDPAQVC